ncbi:MAG: phosphatase PAP2 family protein [Acetobacteraceae bacterium]|nr:phosphatase PAP2 family protein [Acetobacteraceae bacterium]
MHVSSGRAPKRDIAVDALKKVSQGADVVLWQVLQGFDVSVEHALIWLGVLNHELLIRAVRPLLTGLDPVKLGPPVAFLLATWLRRGPIPGRGGVLADSGLVLRGLLGISVALAVGHLAQHAWPGRLRPFVESPGVFPEVSGLAFLQDWGSFPSDHAALAMATWAGSRLLGLLSAAWGIVFVCLPRILFGLHYASDILVGMAIGVALPAMMFLAPLPAAFCTWLRRLDELRPALVILALLLFGWEVIDVFQTARRLSMALWKVALQSGGA